MKRIVITGKDSYIGNHIDSWLNKFENNYEVTQLDVIGDDWKSFSFSNVDAVIHVAGIVHRPEISDWETYKKVNVDLPSQIALMENM